MGILERERDHTHHTLRARHLVGRSRACDLRLDDPGVSGEHARIRWDGQTWWLRDLGSRNGTLVAGRVLEPGQSIPLHVGQRLRFGTPDHTWLVASIDAPVARAVPLGEGPTRVAEDGLLALPSASEPSLVLEARADGTWMAEGPSGAVPVADLAVVEVAGARFRLHLPLVMPATDTVSVAPLQLPEVRLELRVSQHEEHVEVDVISPTRRVRLDPRAHLYPLVILARARLEDRQLPAAEAGWMDRAQLCAMLRTDRGHLNMLFHRCRKQLAAAGVANTAALLERRARSTEVRLGVADVAVGPLDGDARP